MDFKVGDEIHILKRNKRQKKCKPLKIIEIYVDHGETMVALYDTRSKRIMHMGVKGLKGYYLW